MSDGIIFAAPSYAYQVPARMKNLFDRLAFTFHRPRFFNKTCTAILTRGMPVDGKVRKYMESSGENMGFHPVKGCSLWTIAPMNSKQEKQFSARIKQAAGRFYKELIAPIPHKPSLFRLMLFRTSRSGIRASKYAGYDMNYFMDKGWFQSEYYYNVKLGLFKKIMGRFFDFLGGLVGGNM